MQKWGTEGFIAVFKGINQEGIEFWLQSVRALPVWRFWTSWSQTEMTLPLGMFALSAGWLLNTCNAQDSTQHIQLPSPKCQQWQGENTYCRPVLVHFIVHTSHQALGFKCNFWSPVGPETAFLTHSQVMLKLLLVLRTTVWVAGYGPVLEVGEGILGLIHQESSVCNFERQIFHSFHRGR